MKDTCIELVQCTYCLKEISAAEATEDHVIARSWYPANTPPIAKWKVLACKPCNNRYSTIEQDLLCRAAFCMDPADRSVARIVQRALRSIDPKQARSARDIKHRFNKRGKMLQGLKQIDNPNAIGVLPSFRDNFFAGSRTGISVPAKDLKAIVRKWISGIHFCEFQEYIASDQEITVHIVEDEVAETAFAEITQYANRIQKGPGVEVLIWRAQEDGKAMSLFAFNIWQRFRVYGSVEAEAAG